MRRVAALAGVAAALGLLVLSPAAHAAPVTAAATPGASPVTSGSIDAETEAFAIRTEYDLPAPAGSGTVPHVIGEIRRTDGNDQAHGIAGAPTQFDPVVGGEFVDPDGVGGGKPQRKLPQTECFFPGANVDTVFKFPTDVQGQTASTPPTSVSSAQCATGPYAEEHATDSGVGAPGTPTTSAAPFVTSGQATADGVTHPVKGVLLADAAAHASGVAILGVIHIGSVTVSSHSETAGRPGTGKSSGVVTIGDMTVGGVPMSIADNAITVAGQTAPISSVEGQALLDQANGGIASSGCKMSTLSTPSSYPQGFLLSRQPPQIGVSADGTHAASMHGGLLILCNMPTSVTSHFGGFSPERMQVVIGFAYSSTVATTDPGGFGLGDVVGPPTDTRPPAAPIPNPLRGGTDVVPVPTPLALLPITSPAVSQLPVAAPAALKAPGPVAALKIGNYKLDPTARAVLFAVCLVGWLGLTAAGVRAVRGVTAG